MPNVKVKTKKHTQNKKNATKAKQNDMKAIKVLGR